MRYVALLALMACESDYNLEDGAAYGEIPQDMTIRVNVVLKNTSSYPADMRGCLYSDEDTACTDRHRVSTTAGQAQTIELFVPRGNMMVSDSLEWWGEGNNGMVPWDDVFDARNAPGTYTMELMDD